MTALEEILDDPNIREEFIKRSIVEQAVINWQLRWLQIEAHKH